jgi:hypothetical protein
MFLIDLEPSILVQTKYSDSWSIKYKNIYKSNNLQLFYINEKETYL